VEASCGKQDYVQTDQSNCKWTVALELGLNIESQGMTWHPSSFIDHTHVVFGRAESPSECPSIGGVPRCAHTDIRPILSVGHCRWTHQLNGPYVHRTIKGLSNGASVQDVGVFTKSREH